MQWFRNDGGRLRSGFAGETGDCVCRAIAIATGLDYLSIYTTINNLAKSERPGAKSRKGKRSNARTGVFKPTTKKLMQSLGWTWVPTMQIGSGCKVHLRKEELPSGTIIVQLSKHVSAVIDGVVHDIYDPSRDGTRCVYGYWMKE